MRGIQMEKDTILYYGNAAGYVSNGKAVVDPLFQSKELQDFLDRQKDVTEVKWVNGTFDRLTNGRLSLHSSRDPNYTKYCHTVARVAGTAGSETDDSTCANCLRGLRVRIWQLKPDVDIRMKFIGYDELLERFGDPVPENYQAAYDGALDTNDLEEIYAKFNVEHPEGFTGHSLSMSDVVELYDEAGSEFHYVDRFGFKQIDFQPPAQTQTMRL